jgi:hypothetical protein
MFPYTTPEYLLLALIETEWAEHSHGLLSLNITTEKWSDAV